MHRADVNALDNMGQTPLDLAHKKVIKEEIEESGVVIGVLWKKGAKFGKDIKTI